MAKQQYSAVYTDNYWNNRYTIAGVYRDTRINVTDKYKYFDKICPKLAPDTTIKANVKRRYR